MKWTTYLKPDVLGRLTACRSRKDDLENLVSAKWLEMVDAGKDKQGFTREDALVCVLEHLDCNSQYFDLTRDEYNALIH